MLGALGALGSASGGDAHSDTGRAERIVVAAVDGPITPISAGFVIRTLEVAEERGNALFVLELDTPGGLEESMRDIVKAFLGSKVPVAVLVGPPGGRAASAGAIITMAAHVAAMAPGTNIGAAHPVAIGGGEIDGTMREKIENDFLAHVRALAAERGRNAEWAEKAVLESVSATAEEALELGVIDFVVRDLGELMEEVDGLTVVVDGDEPVVLKTADAPVERIEMSRKEGFLFVLSNPTVAYLLGILGAYGILFELWNPGTLFPGIVGGICILLAVIGFQVVPISWAGVGLIGLAMLFFMLEVKVTSYGALTVAGILCMVLGSIVLIDEPSLAIPVVSVVLPVVAFTLLFFLAVVGMALKAQGARVRTGAEGLIGCIGQVRSVLDEGGRPYRVFVNGEYWFASAEGGRLDVGDSVRVVAVEGRYLRVEVER
ncbi:MAG: serine protease [Gemmatimonadetes bacterium]|nr:serine protease [Gemmatimonadota bacterium]